MVERQPGNAAILGGHLQGVAGDVPSNQRSVLTIAYNSSVQMLDMINALLDISRLESGRMPLEVKSCAVRPLVERAVDRLVSLARERNILIQYDIPADLSPALADSDLIVRGAVSTSELARPSWVRYRYRSKARFADRVHSIKPTGAGGCSSPTTAEPRRLSHRAGVISLVVSSVQEGTG